jgi:hypothetical protein
LKEHNKKAEVDAENLWMQCVRRESQITADNSTSVASAPPTA